MNRGLVNLSKLRDNFDKADFKQGKSSYCFIDGDRVIKIYAKKYGENFIPKNVCNLSKFNADTIVFPEEYIYENGKIVGEISKYIKSKPIDESFNDKADVNEIIRSYELVKNDLYLYDNINMADLCPVNILYSNQNGFHIIDTTEWTLQDDSLKHNIYYFNMSLIDALIDYLEIPITYSKFYNKLSDVFLNNVEKYGQAGNELKECLFMLMSNRYNFLKFLIAYINIYKTHYGNEPKTLEDIDEFTKVLKKG